MLNVFKTKHNVGTVGCRLHFEDNTIQHDGVIMFIDKQSKLHVSHKGIQSYFNFTQSLNEVLGSTAALLMIRKNVFNNVGTFNESYLNCFEDVELNLQCLINGYINYCDSNLVAYHYESVTRKEENKIDVSKDYFNSLVPFVSKNFEKVSKYIVKTS